MHPLQTHALPAALRKGVDGGRVMRWLDVPSVQRITPSMANMKTTQQHNKKLLLHASIVGHSGYEPDTLDQAELRSTFLPFGKDGIRDDW